MLRQQPPAPRRRPTPARLGDKPAPDPAANPAADPAAAPGGASAVSPSLAGLGIAGVSRRRVAWVGLTLAAAVIVVGFAGQAAEGARASTRVVAERAVNAEVAAQTEALRRELELVTEDRWILQQARAYRLGSRAERPFALAPDAPALADDAPGSPTRRLGAAPPPTSPLEGWLEVLFGPAPGG